MFWCVGDGNWQHRTSLDEFGFGETRACGPAAHEILLANLFNRTPTYAHMRAICTRDRELNWYSSASGQNMTELISDFEHFEANSTDILNRYPWKSAGYDRASVQQAIDRCYGQASGLIIEVSHASYLPHNEGHGLQPSNKGFIFHHFVSALAYNSETGHLLIANPDREPHSTTPDWLSVTDLMRAQPEALVQVGRQANVTARVPTGWQDNGTTLVCPNTRRAVRGFRDYILNHTWSPADWILEEETAYDPIEIGNPVLGKGTRLVCRFTTLAWTQARGVYLMWTGQELLAWQLRATALTPDYSGILNELEQAEKLVQTAHDAVEKLVP